VIDERLAPPTYRWLLVGALSIGLAVTAWIAASGSSGIDLMVLRRLMRPEVILLLVAATGANLGLRFIRWQFLLRRAGLRRPTRESLRVFLAALSFGFVPLCAGEIAAKGLLIAQGDRLVERRAFTVGLYERLCDVVAISSIGLIGVLLIPGEERALNLLILLPAPLLFLTSRGRRWTLQVARLSVALITRLTRGSAMIDDLDLPLVLSRWRIALVGVALGLLAWGIVSLSVAKVVALSGANTNLSIAPLFAKATLIGGLSLSPAGAGVTGSLFGYDVIRQGGAPGAVFAAVVATRASTVWLALAIGFVALAWGAASTHPTHDHFDRLSPEYDAQIPKHIRDLLVRRKTERMLAHLPYCVGARGIDIGCGHGWYLNALMENGARPTGIDDSAAQARTARTTGADVVRASATRLPFASGSFDFAYAVNVLHHLPGPASQGAALSEASRVLKPGGLFFLHEINVTNPIFRFYMSYVFPLIKRIDEGIEFWLDPENLPLAGTGLCAEQVAYFTFVPDFLPARMMGPALALEARLEASRWRRYSAHYMVVLRKSGSRS
jgi:SAM-dependent methyltransferase